MNFTLDILFGLIQQVLGGFLTGLVMIPVNILNAILTGIFAPAA